MKTRIPLRACDYHILLCGQGGMPEPFLPIVSWMKLGTDWKVASEIILPVSQAPAPKS